MSRAPLRHALRHDMNRVTAAASAPTPFEIFGANLVHEWDFSLSTITIATGISSISDLRGGKNLTQVTGTAQPSLVSAGLQSYGLSDGTNFKHLKNVTMSLSGDLMFLAVAKLNSTNTNKNLMMGTGNTVIQGLSAGTIRGAVQDASGNDIFAAVAADTSLHAFVLRNATGVSRKFYVDGGAGTAGVRTLAASAMTDMCLFATTAGANPADARIYWAGVVSASGALANLNLWGAWAAARFGLTWSTAT